MSALVACAAVLAWAGLAGERAHAPATAATRTAAESRDRDVAASGRAWQEPQRPAASLGRASPRGVGGDMAGTSAIGAPASGEEDSHETTDRRTSPGGGGDPGPRVALERLAPEPGRVTAALRGDDPGSPRRLVLWRLQDGRAARAGLGASRADGSLDFPEVPLAGRGELLVTGAAVSAELAARLPGDRIPIPAAIAAGDDETVRRSLEQEVR